MSHPRSRVPVRRPPRVAGSRLAGRPRPEQRIGAEAATPAATPADAAAEGAAGLAAEASTDVAEPAPAVDDGEESAAPHRPSPRSRATDTAPGGVPVGEPAVPDRVRPRRRGPGWWWVVVLAAAVVALAVVTTLLVLGWRRAEARAQARAQVPSLAKTYAAKILSYDYRHIRADARAAAAVTTGDYRRQYRTSMDQLVIPQAAQVHAVVRAEVLNAGVTSVSDDGHQAVVLVYANQTVTNTRISGSRVDQVRVRLTLVRTGQGWRVAKVDSL